MADPTTTNAIGEAVYIRTDVPNYVEEKKPFRSLEEMVEICTSHFENMTLEKVIIFASKNGAPVSLTLGFIASSRGRQLPKELLEGMKMLPRR